MSYDRDMDTDTDVLVAEVLADPVARAAYYQREVEHLRERLAKSERLVTLADALATAVHMEELWVLDALAAYLLAREATGVVLDSPRT